MEWMTKRPSITRSSPPCARIASHRNTQPRLRAKTRAACAQNQCSAFVWNGKGPSYIGRRRRNRSRQLHLLVWRGRTRPRNNTTTDGATPPISTVCYQAALPCQRANAMRQERHTDARTRRCGTCGKSADEIQHPPQRHPGGARALGICLSEIRVCVGA